GGGSGGGRRWVVGRKLMPLGERQAIHRRLCQIVEHREPVPRRVVLGGSVGYLDQEPTWATNQEGQKVVRGYQVGIDGEAKNPEPFLEIQLPDRFVPVGWSTFELLGAPNVVDQDVDVPVRISDLLR